MGKVIICAVPLVLAPVEGAILLSSVWGRSYRSLVLVLPCDVLTARACFRPHLQRVDDSPHST